jgi:hypothetical protein
LLNISLIWGNLALFYKHPAALALLLSISAF